MESPPHLKEFNLGAASVGDSLGISIADFAQKEKGKGKGKGETRKGSEEKKTRHKTLLVIETLSISRDSHLCQGNTFFVVFRGLLV